MNALSFRLGWPLYAGMLVAGAAAVVASASTLAALAQTAGWSSWTPWLLPAALDIGGCAGGWCWLRPGVPDRARRFGRLVALAGAAGSLIGNAAGHLLTTGYLSAGPTLVVVVGAVPAAVLVALAHLAALLAVPPTSPTAAEPGNAGDPEGERMFEWDENCDPDEQPDPDEPDDTDEHEELIDTRAAVLQLLHQHPLTIAELAKATGRSRTTVIGHLTALTSTGAVHRDDTKHYRATTRPHLITQNHATQNHPTGPEEAAQ